MRNPSRAAGRPFPGRATRAGTFRCEQQEDQIDRLVVQRFEIDGRFKTRKNADDRRKMAKLAMRNGNAIADTGRAQSFALKDDVENFTFG
jgi:hypothetical protein